MGAAHSPLYNPASRMESPHLSSYTYFAPSANSLWMAPEWPSAPRSWTTRRGAKGVIEVTGSKIGHASVRYHGTCATRIGMSHKESGSSKKGGRKGSTTTCQNVRSKKHALKQALEGLTKPQSAPRPQPQTIKSIWGPASPLYSCPASGRNLGGSWIRKRALPQALGSLRLKSHLRGRRSGAGTQVLEGKG